ncbi:hypothetical protein F5Y19DRAFT_80161 [Xylariaceae sp. FL1651]|nr:hypothetical protein F5Y19DRAFT_80161 [Xylariaceae sp. FL1651]
MSFTFRKRSCIRRVPKEKSRKAVQITTSPEILFLGRSWKKTLLLSLLPLLSYLVVGLTKAATSKSVRRAYPNPLPPPPHPPHPRRRLGIFNPKDYTAILRVTSSTNNVWHTTQPTKRPISLPARSSLAHRRPYTYTYTYNYTYSNTYIYIYTYIYIPSLVRQLRPKHCTKRTRYFYIPITLRRAVVVST